MDDPTTCSDGTQHAAAEDGIKALQAQVQRLLQREQELCKEKEEMEAKFGQRRAKFKKLFLQKEEEFCQEQEALEAAKKRAEELELEIKNLQAELNDARSMVTIAECQKENEIEAEKRKCQEEIASLHHIMKETMAEEVHKTQRHYEKEIDKLKKANERLEAELAELRAQQSRDSSRASSFTGHHLDHYDSFGTDTQREGVLAVVTKSLKQRVGGLGPHSFSVSTESTENLEESMRKAQEDAEMLRSLVVPLEEEIRALKDKLRSTDEDLRMYEAAFSGLVKGLGSDSLSEMLKGKKPVEVVGHLDEKLTSLSQGLQAEKASRTDLEMYVAVLNTQKTVMQQDMDKLKQEISEVCQLLEKEKREHAALKRTWQMANDQFLEAQRLQIMDMRRIQSVLTEEQQRQIAEMQQQDERAMEQERARKAKERSSDDPGSKGAASNMASPKSVKIRQPLKPISPLLHRRLRSADSKTCSQLLVDGPLSDTSQRVRSAPGDLSQLGLEALSPKSPLLQVDDTGDVPAKKLSLTRSLSSSMLNDNEDDGRPTGQAFSFDASDLKAETQSLHSMEDGGSPWRTMKLPLLTPDQMKALSDSTPDAEARKALMDNARAEMESISLVGKRLVSEKEWQLLEEELKKAREKLGQTCIMCSNYELQLQQVQESEQAQRQQVASLQAAVERCKNDLQEERRLRHDVEEKSSEGARDAHHQLTELFKKIDEYERAFGDLKRQYSEHCSHLRQQIKDFKAWRDDMLSKVQKLQEENDLLLGRHIAKAQQIGNEDIDLPNNAEEMQFLYLKLREQLITALVEKERKEEALKSEILFLKEEVVAEQKEKQSVEDTLNQDIDSLREQLGILESIRTELQVESGRRADVEKKLCECQTELQALRDRSQKEMEELKAQVDELTESKNKLDEEVLQLRSKVQSLQTDLDTSETVQRDFVKLSQSLQMELEKIRQSDSEVRWQHEDDVNECNGCRKALHSKKEKLHCNHCGKIFCVECASRTVNSGPKQRPFRVCTVCHTLLDHKTAPYFSYEPPQTPS